MPIHLTVSHQEKLVRATAVGIVTVDDLQSYMGSVIAQGAMPYAKLFHIRKDARMGGPGRLSEVADTVRLYDKMKLGEIGPLAVVAESEEAVAHAEAFLRAAPARRDARLFASLEEAESWLRAEGFL